MVEYDDRHTMADNIDGRLARNDIRELNLFGAGDLRWVEKPDPVLESEHEAIVRPFVASRCDGDSRPIHRHVSRGMQAGLRTGLIDPAVGHICGPVPFAGPFPIGHECIAEVMEVGPAVHGVSVGDVVVPWSFSCGRCDPCRRGLTSKCATTRGTTDGDRTLAAYGFGPATGPFGGMVSDLLRVPFAEAVPEPVPVPVPEGEDPLRVAAASDNLSDGWRTVAPRLRARPDADVLVLGGGGQSIGLYAAGIAVALGATRVDYVDSSAERMRSAESLGDSARERSRRSAAGLGVYDIVVEASSSTAGLRAAVRSTAPGGTCTGVGYYVGTNTASR